MYQNCYHREAVRGNLNIGPASKIQKLQNNFVNNFGSHKKGQSALPSYV